MKCLEHFSHFLIDSLNEFLLRGYDETFGGFDFHLCFPNYSRYAPSPRPKGI